MLLTLLILFVFYWLLSSLLMYHYVKHVFQKYKNVPRHPKPEEHRAVIRADMGKWNQKQIIRGCFTRFPFHFGGFLTYVVIFSLMANLKKLTGFPPSWVIEFFKRIFGRRVFLSMMKVEEDFDYKQKFDTPFVVSNHVSENDIFYMHLCLNPVSFVAKKEVSDIYFINAIAVYLKTLFVDRSSTQSRNGTRKALADRVQQFNKSNGTLPPTVIYAQGTCANGRSVITFKDGAFEPMAPLTLISLRYECPEFHLGYDEIKNYELILITFCLKPTLKVKKTRVEAKEGESIAEYRQRCRHKIAEMGELQVCDYTTKQGWEYYNYIQGEIKKQRNMKKD